jgi:hypothetical protein
MQLTRQYGTGTPTVDIHDSIQNATHSGPNIQAVFVLKEDGNIDVWSVPGKPLLITSGGARSTQAPQGPIVEGGVKVSHVVTIVGSPGCFYVNGTRFCT